MTQLYLQRFEYRAATKSEFDQVWAVALQTLHHAMNYGHMADITFEALFDLDAALAQRVGEMRRT